MTDSSTHDEGPARRLALTLFVLSTFAAVPAAAQTGGAAGSQESDTLVFLVDPIVVTATRGPRAVSRIPQPVSVVGRQDLVRRIPNTVTDLFRALPGLDVTGVGINQGRPQIRGQRGQRILLLEDGLRLNNFRRQQDFGELPALVDVTGVERVEVVRGPASVLYGSDAIGGVVNIITRTPEEDGVHGTASLKYGDVEAQKTGSARVYGRFGSFTLRAGGTVREADPYLAPGGTFGEIELEDETTVLNSGVTDRALDVRFGWEPAGRHSFFGKLERYDADDAGFGSVDPERYDPGAPSIDITYPSQTWSKLTAGWLGQELGTALADQVQLLAYGQDNERDLHLGFSMALAPGADMKILNRNFTDVRTYGMRAEARKLATPDLLLTYGVDVVRERAEGKDLNTTTITGFGPEPIVDSSDRPQLPESQYTTFGLFAQGEVEVTERFSFVAGGRYQSANARTFATEGLEDQQPVDITDGTFVAAVNSLFDLGGGFSLVGSVGRAFRSPNLIERFFDGPTPEGSGYQVRNPELKPETSLNVDVGVRYRVDRVALEAFAFRNEIRDGIRIEPLMNPDGSPQQVDGMNAYRNTNVDELVFRGVELGAQVPLVGGLGAEGSYSWMEAEDALNEENPVGESFNSKVSGTLRYQHPSDRFWAAWEVRHNGERKDVELGDNVIGEVLPSFTVQNLRAGVTLFRTDGGQTHRLDVALTNLTNELYAEFSNAAFFRPEPKRNLTLAWQVSF